MSDYNLTLAECRRRADILDSEAEAIEDWLLNWRDANLFCVHNRPA